MTSSHGATDRGHARGRREASSIYGALKRYGVRKAFLSKWTAICLVSSILLPNLVPWGRYDLLPVLISIHATLLGFGLTVFGFVVIGGKDDFFLPIVKSKNFNGMAILERMSLYLIWPVLLHGVCLLLILVRLTIYHMFSGDGLLILGGLWRVLYVFFALWSILQNYFSMNYLFRIALIRLRFHRQEDVGNADGIGSTGG
ncbi:MAG: hypothetical protein ACX94C_02005 [Phycisphaerales bacterium]